MHISQETRYCVCGCGNTFICKLNSKKRFISGHNSRGRKRKPLTKAQRKLISIKTKEAMYSIEVQRKLHRSKRIKIISNCQVCGKKIEDYHIRKVCSLKCSAKLHSISYKHSEKTKERIRIARYKQKIPNNNTLPEQIVERILLRNNLRYKRQWNVDFKMLVDFYLPDYNIMIFADGDFWHCHKKFNYKDEDMVHHGKTKKEIIDKDTYQTQYLKDKGYLVLRFWESDLKNREKEVENQLKEATNERKDQVVCKEPLVKIPLFAGKSGESLDTIYSDNFKVQTISRQPVLNRESSETTRGKLLIS